MRAKAARTSRPGQGVDSYGAPAYDPTQNVLDLTIAASKRQDDLREATARRLDEMAILRSDHTKEITILRAEHAKEIQALESNRLNAIRQVDVLAVNTAADRAAAAIQALAATTASNAENLRNALTTTAAAIAVQNTNTVAAITERIGLLEKALYEGRGKSALADPQMAEMISELKGLRDSRASGTGRSEGLSQSAAILIGVVAIIGTMIAGAAFVYEATRPPQVIYAPSPGVK